MPGTDTPLLAHLLRRAGFGATFQELDQYSQVGYEAVVEDLLHPEQQPPIEEDVLERYYIDWKESRNIEGALTESVYRMNSYAGKRPLQEKIALFWHQVFATGLAKVLHEKTMLNQIDLFRQHGLGNFRDLLVHLAKDPAMIFWLDNNFNHKDALNENWGRELLELFSMGVGMDGRENYSEEDVKSAARAFTGWTIDDDNVASIPFGKTPWLFRYEPDQHDEGEKTFMGHTGNFNGEDIIDIIVKQEATARFVTRHLCNFFVEDEPQVPAWNIEKPKDPDLIDELSEIFMATEGDMKSVLRALFNSDGFKSSINKPKVKSPTELVMGVLRQVGSFNDIKPGLEGYWSSVAVMGQELLNPPTVEGWHTGHEWIDSGTLSERINFASQEFQDTNKPGVKDIIERAGSLDEEPCQLVDRCLDVLGGVQVSSDTYSELTEYVNSLKKQNAKESDSANISDLIQMIVSTVDYQYA